jgi:methionyl-tRNA synthetase
MFKKKFYLTTSIAYANAFPHIGFALESVQADILARYHRQLGSEVFFLTGTDEHGRKVAESAAKAGQTPQEFTDKISAKFRDLGRILNLSNDDFIRTTDKLRHWPSVEKVWQVLEKKGDIYKKKYRGLYCLGCEAFITKKDLQDGKCPIHQKMPEEIEEENYFFRLSKYEKEIEKIIKQDKLKIIPLERKNEMLSFLGQGLEDISFSRPRKDLSWSVPVPSDPSASVYVWADALTNYLSAIGYADDEKKFKKFWPADVHCIGKDIQKFHCLIWPGMLLSLGLPLPKTIFVHGLITIEGQKMSKSLGNVIDPFELVNKYGTDPVRYFLLREVPPSTDGDFSYEKFEQRYNSDLAKGLGNLVARVITLSGSIQEKKESSSAELALAIRRADKNYQANLAEFKFNEALFSIWEIISFCDQYIEKEKPWQENSNRQETIGNLLLALKTIANLSSPFLPETASKILEQLKSRQSQSLFPRL